MKIAIVGGTGTLGRQIARRALDEGHEVRCLIRNYGRAGFLKEWGAELIQGNLCQPQTLPPFLEGADAVIDAATTRPTDSLTIKKLDWQGKVSLIKAAASADIERFIFFSFLDAEKYQRVPLLEIKRCTELFLAESGLKYTILRPCGFLQGLIGQYAVPILDNQGVWVPGKGSAIAYMDTQDIAKFAIKALSVPETENKSFPVVGPRAWEANEIIRLCERLSGEEAKVTRTNPRVLGTVRNILRSFQWSQEIANRLAFAEVLAAGEPLAASMDETYKVFGIDPEETTTLESYLQDYYSRILKKLKELEYEKSKGNKGSQSKKPFFF